MTDGIVWEDPPHAAGSNRRGVWAERLAPLRERPGEWARVREFPSAHSASSAATTLRRGVPGVDPNVWEFTSRRADDGTGFVYARYIGEGGTP